MISPFQNITVTPGSVTAISVRADGTPPFHYRWYDADAPSVTLGTDSPTLFTPPVTKTTEFHVVISNGCGQGDFFPALVKTEACDAPQITTQPQDAKVRAFGQVTTQVVATGKQPLSYQWLQQVSGGVVEGVGSNSPALVFSAAADLTCSLGSRFESMRRCREQSCSN